MWWLLLVLALLVAVPTGIVALLRPGVLASVGVVAAVVVGLALMVVGLAYVSLETVLSKRSG